MKTFLYYIGYVLLPLLFLIHLVRNLYRSTKIALHNTVVQTSSDILSHKRAYDKE